ncbi:hypothetical protein COX58_02295 [archaeon CG_4_10_14_0_2_um_filter_Archaea_38_6]|nr:MAG: hypothetical protein COX58_02295 [archaeon CG_4_10_14_0_2_um_filter_Archaea_38_6]
MDNYYDTIAEGYNNLYSKEQFLKWEKIRDCFDFKGLVLDAGCGTGIITQEILNVVGCDSSIKMLEKCKKGLRLVQASVEALPFKDEVFDTVFSLTVLQDLENAEKTIKEFRRVLKSNGNLIVSVLNKNKAGKIRAVLEKYFPEIQEEIIGKDVLFFRRK